MRDYIHFKLQKFISKYDSKKTHNKATCNFLLFENNSIGRCWKIFTLKFRNFNFYFNLYIWSFSLSTSSLYLTFVYNRIIEIIIVSNKMLFYLATKLIKNMLDFFCINMKICNTICVNVIYVFWVNENVDTKKDIRPPK